MPTTLTRLLPPLALRRLPALAVTVLLALALGLPAGRPAAAQDVPAIIPILSSSELAVGPEPLPLQPHRPGRFAPGRA